MSVIPTPEEWLARADEEHAAGKWVGVAELCEHGKPIRVPAAGVSVCTAGCQPVSEAGTSHILHGLESIGFVFVHAPTPGERSD